MGIFEKMVQMRQLETEIAQMVEELKEELYRQVENQPFSGHMLSDGKEGRALIGIISLSDLETAGSWSPECHLPYAQANAIKAHLKGCKTADSLCKAIREMLEEKKIRAGSGNNYVHLNPQTLIILKKSGLGLHVTNKALQV